MGTDTDDIERRQSRGLTTLTSPYRMVDSEPSASADAPFWRMLGRRGGRRSALALCLFSMKRELLRCRHR
jgi:hypothetical protein